MRLLPTFLLALAMWPGHPAVASADQTAMCDVPPCTRAEIEGYERRVIKHLLRVQQMRAEAMARGDKRDAQRFQREFQRTQDRRVVARRAIEHVND